MEKDRSSKIIAIIALVIGVIGLSIGFAAFSSTLTISQSAEVNPDASRFKVLFSSSEDTLQTSEVEGKVSGVNQATAQSASINNDSASSPSITGLKATFKDPGDSVTYTFYVTNQGDYKAYLKTITFDNVTDGSSNKECSAKEGTTEALVKKACDSIELSISVGENNDLQNLTTTKSDIKSHALDKKAFEKVVVKIEYKADESNDNLADGDFDVKFGDIKLTYSSAD